MRPHSARQRRAAATAAGLLLAVAFGNSLAVEQKIYVGTVSLVGPSRLMLDLGDQSLVDIGFKCLPQACTSLKRVQPGDRIEAVFDDQDLVTNTLVALRFCGDVDAACDSALERQRKKVQDDLRQYEASIEIERQKYAAMDAMFRANGDLLKGLPTCAPSRSLLKVDLPDIPAKYARATGAVTFLFALDPDGKARSIAVALDEMNSPRITKALLDSLAGAQFDKPAARCRQQIKMSTRLVD